MCDVTNIALSVSDQRLSNFVIGTSLSLVHPALDNYAVCVTRVEAVGRGRTQTFGCRARARYVIIQLQGSDVLTLCEVQVFAGDDFFQSIFFFNL